jgi:hypothetical protein
MQTAMQRADASSEAVADFKHRDMPEAKDEEEDGID